MWLSLLPPLGLGGAFANASVAQAVFVFRIAVALQCCAQPCENSTVRLGSPICRYAWLAVGRQAST